MGQILLSDLGSLRRPRLVGATAAGAAKAAAEGRHLRELERRRAEAKARLQQLALAAHRKRGDLHARHFDYLSFADSRRGLEHDLEKLLARAAVCTSQAELDEALAAEAGCLICLGEERVKLEALLDYQATFILLGQVDLDLQAFDWFRLDACEESRASFGHYNGENDSYVASASETAEIEPLTPGYVHCYHRSVARPAHRRVNITLRDQARCLLGQANAVEADYGTTIVLGKDVSCQRIEMDDSSDRGERPFARVVDAKGALLFDGSELYDEQGKLAWDEGVSVRGIPVTPIIPF